MPRFTQGEWYFSNGYVRLRSDDERKNEMTLATTLYADTYEEKQANGRLMPPRRRCTGL